MIKKRTSSVLTAEETEILSAYEKGTLKQGSVPASMVKTAREMMRKKRNINIRISESDLESIKKIAEREGLPYQTLIGSVLHKFAGGLLK
ncbi:MAG: hypothetical protein JW794_10085 [Candidatus Cloacimonetes bacterium]|nr:hypothetical protein [Candidatus Cloacimonadota bacterium]